MVVEQFYLLSPQSQLNTLRVSNNPSGSNALALYMYNRDYSVMYFSSYKQIDFIRCLNIHPSTFTKHLENGTYYLKKYVFSREKIGEAIAVEMNPDEIKAMLEHDRAHSNRNKSFIPGVILKHLVSEQELKFENIESCLIFLKEQGYKANRKYLIERLKTNLSYYGYICSKVEK